MKGINQTSFDHKKQFFRNVCDYPNHACNGDPLDSENTGNKVWCEHYDIISKECTHKHYKKLIWEVVKNE